MYLQHHGGSVMRQLRGRCSSRDERGATAVELAVIMPFIAILLVASIDIATMFDKSQELEGAARDGARHASTEELATKAEITTRVEDALTGLTGVTVTVTPDQDAPCDGRGGDPVVVTAQITRPLTLLFVSTVDIDLAGSASFICTTDQ